MQGDQADFAGRLAGLLPAGWFEDAPPVLTGVLNGFAAGWALLWQQLAFVQTQLRIKSVTGDFLDMASEDFFGTALPRRAGETDDSYRARVLAALLLPKGTRAALIARLTALTGNVPVVFEPMNTGDAGAWNVGTVGWAQSGGWGSLAIPWQFFVTVQRPVQAGAFPGVSGWSSGGGGWGIGAASYADMALDVAQITDADIYAAVADVIPASVIAWTALTGQPIGGEAAIGQFVIGTNTIS